MNEAQTRQNIIDNRLQEAGWNVDDVSQVVEEFVVEKSHVAEPTQKYGNTFSDYVLLGKGGKLLNGMWSLVVRFMPLEKKYVESAIKELENELYKTA